MKSKNLVAIIDSEHSEMDDGRLEDRGKRVMMGEGAEMGLGRVGGTEVTAGENEMR